MSDTTHNPSKGSISGLNRAFVGSPSSQFYLFVGSGHAFRMQGSSHADTFAQAFTIVARDAAEAERAAMRMLKDNSPERDGWWDHSVRMDMIPRATIEEWLRDTAPPPEGTT